MEVGLPLGQEERSPSLSPSLLSLARFFLASSRWIWRNVGCYSCVVLPSDVSSAGLFSCKSPGHWSSVSWLQIGACHAVVPLEQPFGYRGLLIASFAFSCASAVPFLLPVVLPCSAALCIKAPPPFHPDNFDSAIALLHPTTPSAYNCTATMSAGTPAPVIYRSSHPSGGPYRDDLDIYGGSGLSRSSQLCLLDVGRS